MKCKTHFHIFAPHPIWKTHYYCTVAGCGFPIFEHHLQNALDNGAKLAEGVTMPIKSDPSDIVLLKDIAAQLERWARESKAGGWSTHQVEPQRQLADKIWAHIGRKA